MDEIYIVIIGLMIGFVFGSILTIIIHYFVRFLNERNSDIKIQKKFDLLFYTTNFDVLPLDEQLFYYFVSLNKLATGKTTRYFVEKMYIYSIVQTELKRNSFNMSNSDYTVQMCESDKNLNITTTIEKDRYVASQ